MITLIENIKILATPQNGKIVKRQNVKLVIDNDKIQSILPQNQAVECDQIIDAQNGVALPGFVDCHTHLVFGGERSNEFNMRAAGKTYQEIRDAGGGILSSVTSTRNAFTAELVAIGKKYLNDMLSYGVTTVEAKSGYGLDTDTEIKQLRVIKKLNQDHVIDLVPTFLGAHEFPVEYENDHDAYIDLIINEMLPRVAEENLAVFCDVFCEKGVYTPEQSLRVLTAGKEYGLLARVHADEFSHSFGAEVAADVRAISADHLLKVSDKGILDMAKAHVTGVFLPGVCLFLKQDFPNARRLIDQGVSIALATDFNPGSSMTTNVPLIMSLACIYMGMTVDEVIQAVTINAARVLQIENKVGSIEPGKYADVTIWDVPDVDFIPYYFASSRPLKVIKKGTLVYECNT